MHRIAIFITMLSTAAVGTASTMFSDAGGGNLRTAPGFSLGVQFTFTSGSPLFLTALGLYDPSGNALADTHEVGLWDVTAGNVEIGDAFITAGTTNGGTPGFLFVSVGYIPLTSGDVYKLAAYYSSTSTDQLLDCCQGAAPTTDAHFSALSGAFTASNVIGSLSEPNGNAGHAYVGPNLQFAPAPEPATALMVVSAGILLAVRFRWRR